MDSTDGRIVVMQPDAVATAAVINDKTAPHSKDGTEIIAGNDVVLFVARGEGSYHANGRSSILRPNTLISAPAGTLACELSDDREMYVIAVREPVTAPDDPNAFSPFLERHLTPSEGNRWRQRMMDYADRASAGRFGVEDVRRLKNAVLPYVWKREPHAAQSTLQELFASIWTRLAQPLTLDGLARDVGYTANYLNDLTREHTGRALGSWIADMRMARARAALEITELSVAEIGVSCGYDDPAYFSRAFRRAHGVPPATWRVGKRPDDSRYAGVTMPIELLHEIETSLVLPQRAYSFAS
jgi:AraC-like DNA-binding protein